MRLIFIFLKPTTPTSFFILLLTLLLSFLTTPTRAHPHAAAAADSPLHPRLRRHCQLNLPISLTAPSPSTQQRGPH
ncbi:hypothetical protein FF2_022386 [Malus domestica]